MGDVEKISGGLRGITLFFHRKPQLIQGDNLLDQLSSPLFCLSCICKRQDRENQKEDSNMFWHQST